MAKPKNPKKTKSPSSPVKRKGTAKKSTSTAVATVDPLTRYLNQIGRYELLTPEEEHNLAVHYSKTQDPKAAYELAVRNLRLVVKIAMEYRRAWTNVLDLIQEGNLGLMTAIQRFDPYRETRLTTYAAWWIRAYILKFIMSNWRLIKIGNTQAERKLFYNLKRETERLLAEGFIPAPKLLAERLKVNETDVVEMSKRMSGPEMSLDLPRGGEDAEGPVLGETLPNQADRMEESLADQELRDVVRDLTEEFKKTLPEREIMLLDRRILAEEPVTLQEIGDALGVSRERVRQLEERLMKRLKEYIESRKPDLRSALDD